MNQSKLKRNTVAAKVLSRLVDLGGTSKISNLLGVVSHEYQRLDVFQHYVIDLLVRAKYVTINRDEMKATVAGKSFAGGLLDHPLPVAESFVGQIARPRTVVSKGTLQVKNPYAGGVFREGAFDHLNIPSRMGSQRILPSGEVVE